MELLEAVQALDSNNEEHWTVDGLPRVDAVTALFGAPVTREDINAVAPGYTKTNQEIQEPPVLTDSVDDTDEDESAESNEGDDTNSDTTTDEGADGANDDQAAADESAPPEETKDDTPSDSAVRAAVDQAEKALLKAKGQKPKSVKQKPPAPDAPKVDPKMPLKMVKAECAALDEAIRARQIEVAKSEERLRELISRREYLDNLVPKQTSEERFREHQERASVARELLREQKAKAITEAKETGALKNLKIMRASIAPSAIDEALQRKRDSKRPTPPLKTAEQ